MCASCVKMDILGDKLAIALFEQLKHNYNERCAKMQIKRGYVNTRSKGLQ
jgi:hypothetical protein